MDEFVDTALAFPTALFSFSLVVVAAYWTLVLLGGLGHFHAGTDGHTGAGAGAGGHAHGGGVPATVTLSLLIALAWPSSGTSSGSRPSSTTTTGPKRGLSPPAPRPTC
ncbi:hypothetical protein [Actinomadura sp. NTSP31]|uniref:hypothetical protein n=1 Tax=Actinomadura sp. NTSP31 TaxID=1735447 RepID=UPI0035C00E6A